MLDTLTTKYEVEDKNLVNSTLDDTVHSKRNWLAFFIGNYNWFKKHLWLMSGEAETDYMYLNNISAQLRMDLNYSYKIRHNLISNVPHLTDLNMSNNSIATCIRDGLLIMINTDEYRVNSTAPLVKLLK